MCVLVGKGLPAVFNEAWWDAWQWKKICSPSLCLFANSSSNLPPSLFISICFCLICPSHPFQSIFICVASRSLAQSISVHRESSTCLPLSLSLSVSVFFLLFLLLFDLWETLKGLCYELQSLPWWPALTDSSYRGLFIARGQGGHEGMCMYVK